MIRLVEVVLGLVLIYVGLERFSGADKIQGLAFGGLAIAGLILAVHGILLFNVPDFFKFSG
jgi:ABC-type Fe3+ transport system permease subunit